MTTVLHVAPHPDDEALGAPAALLLLRRAGLVARATRRALSAAAEPPTWWTWGLWADLARPTVYVPFGDDVLQEAHDVLHVYAGELARNDYARLLTARATANAVLGSERVFGFGAERASTEPYADLLTELRMVDGDWVPDTPRCLDPRDPLPDRGTRSMRQR